MATAAKLEQARLEGWSDDEVVRRVLEGEPALFEVLMRRHNQRLYRAARAILRDDAEAEDVMQDAYVRAYQHLDQFAGKAQFSTWLTRIAIHEALARAHRRGRWESLDSGDGVKGESMVTAPKELSPERQALSSEVSRLLEAAILALPDPYRTVLVLRDVEEMSTAETAAVLDISEDNVKVRLHRARALLRRELYARAGATSTAAFQFPATRCDRVVKAVFERLAGGPEAKAGDEDRGWKMAD